MEFEFKNQFLNLKVLIIKFKYNLYIKKYFFVIDFNYIKIIIIYEYFTF